jgi:KaiC/GvpD/RAD55 family RecA-like ATPase
MDALEGFASGGLRVGEGNIIIATQAHRAALERRLRVRGYDVDQARAEDRYIAVDAEFALAQFLADGWPVSDRFQTYIGGLMRRARDNDRRVRAFDEMAALTWGQGHYEATAALEDLWNRLHQNKAFCLFCAYPRRSFGDDHGHSMADICGQHSRVIPE